MARRRRLRRRASPLSPRTGGSRTTNPCGSRRAGFIKCGKTSRDLAKRESIMPSAEARLKELKIQLPPAPKPVAKYRTAVLAGNTLYVSGHGPAKLDAASPVAGRVGADLSLEQG